MALVFNHPLAQKLILDSGTCNGKVSTHRLQVFHSVANRNVCNVSGSKEFDLLQCGFEA